MNPSLLLCCLVICLSCCVSVHTHMLMEDKHISSQTTISGYLTNYTDTPPVLIVGLSTPKKNKKPEKKAKKNKYSSRVKKPAPPPNCVPLWGSCKGPSAVCCEPCAFCHCRLFKTVCYCRMGYPKC